jgi:hypothetical protein
MLKEMRVPTTANNVMVMKLRKNCFFFTWNLTRDGGTKMNCESCNTLLLQRNFQLCTRTLGEILKYPYHTSLLLYKKIDLSIIKEYFII